MSDPLRSRTFWRTFWIGLAVGTVLLALHAHYLDGAVQAGGIRVAVGQPYLDAPTTVIAVGVIQRTRLTSQPAGASVRLYRGGILRATRSGTLYPHQRSITIRAGARCVPSARLRLWWAVIDGLSRGRSSQATSYAVRLPCR